LFFSWQFSFRKESKVHAPVKSNRREALSVNEGKMYILIKYYLIQVLDEPTLDFKDEQFRALMDQLFEKDKIEAIKNLRGMFPMKEKQWIQTDYASNEFYKFINEDFSHIKPEQCYGSDLGVREAKDIVDWIEANRQYTQY